MRDAQFYWGFRPHTLLCMRCHLRMVGLVAGLHLMLTGGAALLLVAASFGGDTRDPRGGLAGDVAGHVVLWMAEPMASLDAALGLTRRYGDVVGLALVPLNSLVVASFVYLGWRWIGRRAYRDVALDV